MTRDIKHPTPAPSAVSGNQEQNPDTDEIRAIALRVGTGGDLHPYLPKQPDWCQTIGDDVCATLDRGEPVSEADFVRLSYALGFGESREGSPRNQGKRD